MHWLSGKRALVTGASGFLGSHLVERLLCEGGQVSALARSEGNLAHVPRGYGFLRCDITDAQQTREAISSFVPQVVFHFASYPDGSEDAAQAELSIQINALGTLNVLEAFRLCGGELFVNGDSCKVYGASGVPYREATPMNPISSYAIAKAAGWQLCELYRRLHGVPTVSVRPTLIYGPRQPYNLITFVVDCVLDKRPTVPLSGGAQTRDPLFVNDAMEAFVAVARLGPKLAGRVINIGGGNERTVAEIAAMIVELMGHRAEIVVSAVSARPTEMWRSYCDNAEAREILGWMPRTNLSEGLERTIRYLVEARDRAAIGS